MITLVLANSSPCAPAIRKTLKSPDFKVFLCFSPFFSEIAIGFGDRRDCFPLWFPLYIIYSALFSSQTFIESLHPGSAVSAHLFGHVTVNVQGEGRRCVTQVFLHGFDIVPCQQRSHGEAVAHIMKSRIPDTDSACNGFEMLYNRSANEVLSAGICKDKIEGIVPDLPCLLPGVLLFFLLCFQRIHDQLCRKDSPGFVAFGRTEEILPVFVLKLLLHGNHTAFKVDAIPGQTQQLPLAHSGKQCDGEDVPIVIVFRFLKNTVMTCSVL